MEFLKRKKKLEIEELNIMTQNKIQKIAKEKSELEDEALEMEKKAQELEDEALEMEKKKLELEKKKTELVEKAKKKREIIQLLENNENSIKANKKNEKKIIEEKIKAERERGIRRIQESLELFQIAKMLEPYGAVVDCDIKEFVVEEKSS